MHRYVYDRLNKRWYCLCTTRTPHGRVVDSTVEVTCQKCS